MLRLENIEKTYTTGGTASLALKGISLCFRDHEFVSILGPSGCGKTTLLNIIGGLDHASGGELYIDGVSTKDYKSRDWDNYRNHRIGFVFQSYNLIPHQTISENVELALAISGVEKKERVLRAHEALDKVGLMGLYEKKPNQLSGGQCQRVAIARALVNKPEILLADEPTGALDAKTSVQIMELIKELSKECLVIMVTHNPELAERYSSRIIRLLDGRVVGDTDPYERPKEMTLNEPQGTRMAKLSLWSAFKLSYRNLLSKMKRTSLVSIAGAIGIIGVASVLSVPTGVSDYIDDTQNDMLSGNPLTVSEESLNLSSLLSRSSENQKKEALKEGYEEGYLNVNKTIDSLISQFADSDLSVKNDLNEDYLSYVSALPKDYYSAMGIEYGLSLKNNIYTFVPFDGYDESELLSLGASLGVYRGILEDEGLSEYSSFVDALSSSISPLLDSEEFILSQYDLLYGDYIGKGSKELTLVLGNDYEANDSLLAELGFYSQGEFMNQIYKATKDERYDASLERDRFSFEEIVSKPFYFYPNDDVFTKTPELLPLSSTNPFTYSAYREADWGEGEELHIASILKPKEGLSYGCLSSGLYYSSALEKGVLEISKASEIVDYLKYERKRRLLKHELWRSQYRDNLFLSLSKRRRDDNENGASWRSIE